VYWAAERRFFAGTVVEYSEVSPPGAFENEKQPMHVHLVAYDDGEDVWEPLLESCWHFLNADRLRVDKDFVVKAGAGGRLVAAPTVFSPPDFKDSGNAKRKRASKNKVTALVPAEPKVTDEMKAAVASASRAVDVARQQNNPFKELECLRHFHTLVQEDLLPKL
jgi:hypothetical protein